MFKIKLLTLLVWTLIYLLTDSRQIYAISECTKSGFIINTPGDLQFGKIIKPPKGSDYSVWEPIVPQAIAVDSKGNVFIGDSVKYRVLKFDKSGKFIRKFSLQPPVREKIPELSHFIEDMTTDKDDNLYVINILEYRVEKYTPDGTFLSFINYYDDALNDAGKSKKNFHPGRVTVDQKGNVYLYNIKRDCTKQPSGGIYSRDGRLLKKGVCASIDGKSSLNFNEKDMVGYSGYYYKIKSLVQKSDQNKRTISIIVNDKNGNIIKRCDDLNIDDVGGNIFKGDQFGNLYTFDYYKTLNVIKISPNIK